MDVIFYLEEICPSNKNDINDSVDSKKMFVLSLLQENPRILRQNLENKLKPTVQFLMDLYGDELFQQAIKKNPSLLLLSGVGFNNNNSKQKTNNNDSDENLYNNQHNKHYDSIDDFLQKELNLSLNKIQKFKKTSPKIFQLSLRKNIIPVIQFLADLIDDHTDYNNNNDYDENDEYSVHKEKLTRKLTPRTQNMITHAISSYPALLQLSVEMNLQPTVEFLQKECFMEYYEYDEHGDAKTQNDRKSNSNNNNNKALLNIIKTCPSTLGLSVKDNLRPTVEYLKRELQLEISNNNQKNTLKACLSKHPQILSLSIEKNLEQKVTLFNSISSNNDNEKGNSNYNSSSPQPSSSLSLAHRIAVGAPSVYSLSIENIQTKLDSLSQFWGTTQEEESKRILAQRISEYPPILTLSLEANIKPTMNFYNRTGYVSLDEDGNSITTKSKGGKVKTKSIIRARHLATSLYNRLLPRWHYLVDEINIEQIILSSLSSSDMEATLLSKSVASSSMNFPPPIRILASATDEQFCDYYGIDNTDFQQYKEKAIPQLKFSTQFVTWIKTGRPIEGV